MRRKRRSPTKRVSKCWSRGRGEGGRAGWTPGRTSNGSSFCSLFRKLISMTSGHQPFCISWWYHWFFIQLRLSLVKAPLVDHLLTSKFLTNRFPHAFSSPDTGLGWWKQIAAIRELKQSCPAAPNLTVILSFSTEPSLATICALFFLPRRSPNFRYTVQL